MQPYDMKEIEERVILVGVQESFSEDIEESLDELAELCETAGATVVGRVIQNREKIHPGTYIGKGKMDEVALLTEELDATGIVCDDELSPAQLNNLEKELGCKVMDRTLVILDIFAGRANTSEGNIQVELALLRYRAARLVGLRSSLSRLGGGIGTRGPGEKKLEMDRRLIHARISQLKAELAQVQKHRELIRGKRKKDNLVVAAIVGYTNAGKSTLLNALTGAEVHANDRLFDTLDPTTRVLHTEQLGDVLISDTVGFIRKLPHHLVDAFRSTLEELSYADVLVHVVDASDPQWRLLAQVVEDLCRQLGAEKTPRLLVFNKVDLLREDQLPRETGAIYTAASKGLGLDNLVDRICRVLGEGLKTVRFVLPYSQAGVLDRLYREANVKKADYVENGIDIEAVVDRKTYGRIRELLPQDQR